MRLESDEKRKLAENEQVSRLLRQLYISFYIASKDLYLSIPQNSNSFIVILSKETQIKFTVILKRLNFLIIYLAGNNETCGKLPICLLYLSLENSELRS